MKETAQPPKDPKKKLWIGYAVILAIVILSNIFLFPAVMQASVKSVNYSTFLQMLESKELSTVQIEDQQIYFVDKNDNSYKTNAIAQDNNLVTRLEDAGVEFGTVAHDLGFAAEPADLVPADDHPVLVRQPLGVQKDAGDGRSRRQRHAVRRQVRREAVRSGR